MKSGKKILIWAGKIAGTTLVAAAVVLGAAWAFGWSLAVKNQAEG